MTEAKLVLAPARCIPGCSMPSYQQPLPPSGPNHGCEETLQTPPHNMGYSGPHLRLLKCHSLFLGHQHHLLGLAVEAVDIHFGVPFWLCLPIRASVESV